MLPKILTDTNTTIMFLIKVSSAHQGCIHLIKKYSKNLKYFLQFKIAVFCVILC